MKSDRRVFLKSQAMTAAAAAAGIPIVAEAQKAAPAAPATGVRWDKAPCRFCGTGCSVMVGVQEGKVVATQGDPEAPVNRGLNCIKGYFLSKIMYGKDRLTTPLLRKKNGQYDKNGEFTPISWNEAFDIMAVKWKEALKAGGPGAIGMFGSGQWTVWEGYAASKLWKAGFRSNNIDPNARHCMASAVTGFMRTFGIDEPMGCYDDIEQADAFVLWGSNMAEMHPILWSRITDRRLSQPNCKVAVLSTFEHRSFDLADQPIIFAPQTDLAIMNYIANYIITNKAVNQDFIKKNVNFKAGETDIGYGLRPNHPLEKDAKANGYAGADGKPKTNPNDAKPITFDEFAKFISTYTAEYTSKLSGVPVRQLEALARAYPLDGIQLDYIRYPRVDGIGTGFCYCAYCRKTFGGEARCDPMDIAPDTHPGEWRRWDTWREDRVTSFVAAAHARLHAARPGITVSAAIFPDHEESLREKHQDWVRWAREGMLDLVCTMTYRNDAKGVEQVTRRNMADVGRVPLMVGLGPFLRFSDEHLVDQVCAARAAGAAGQVLFAEESLTREHRAALKAGPYRNRAEAGF